MKELAYTRSLLPAADRYATKTAVLDGDYTATYGEHAERVLRLADGMRSQLGVQQEDRFAVMAFNCHEYLELYHAGFIGAGVINPLNLRLAPKELEYILQDSGTKVVFADFFFAPLIDNVRANTDIEKVVLIGEEVVGEVPHDVRYDELLAAGAAVVPAEPDEDDAVILMYTGGTTGLPKGVVIDSRAAILDMYKIAASFPFDDSYVYLHQTPMFHAASFGGILTIPASGGSTTFVPVFDPSNVLDVIEKHQVSTTVMVPTMIQMLLDHPSFEVTRLASMRALVYGASPMPTALLERLLGLYPALDVYQGYGMTENCGLLTVLRPEDHRAGGARLRSAGRPVMGAEVTIQDAAGKIMPAGESGEVCARSGNFMREYWKQPEQTAHAFEGGWYHTGDAGFLDDEGFLFLVDRVKDMIVTGGENVYSAEVENAIASHPAVIQVAAIGIPSEKWGEAVHVIVVTAPDATVTDTDIIDWARERIAGYKIPKSVELRTEPLPLSGAMKVLKRELRAPFWEGKDRAVQ